MYINVVMLAFFLFISSIFSVCKIKVTDPFSSVFPYLVYKMHIK